MLHFFALWLFLCLRTEHDASSCNLLSYVDKDHFWVSTCYLFIWISVRTILGPILGSGAGRSGPFGQVYFQSAYLVIPRNLRCLVVVPNGWQIVANLQNIITISLYVGWVMTTAVTMRMKLYSDVVSALDQWNDKKLVTATSCNLPKGALIVGYIHAIHCNFINIFIYYYISVPNDSVQCLGVTSRTQTCCLQSFLVHASIKIAGTLIWSYFKDFKGNSNYAPIFFVENFVS